MNQKKFLAEIRQELKKYVDLEYREAERRFFKEKIKNLGVRMPDRRKVAKKYFKKIKELEKKEVFEICEKLLQGYGEEATVAFSWIYGIKEKYEKKDFKIFEKWVKQYVDNWAKCDDFCTHSVGHLVYLYPELTKELLKWAESSNRWVKRAAAVTLIYPFGGKKKYLKTIIKVAGKLLMDEDDMVQKGYGWMLKEASKPHQKEVFEFVMKHKNRMPRTALRYAIELMPKGLKKQAMAKSV
jgi:3-methyladenine DNA glycosylase AlkD